MNFKAENKMGFVFQEEEEKKSRIHGKCFQLIVNQNLNIPEHCEVKQKSQTFMRITTWNIRL